MICTQPYTLDLFNVVAVPERFQAEWKSLCFGFAKKSYSRFNELKRIVTITASQCGGIRLEPINDNAFVDSENVQWQRLSFSVIFSSDVREALSALAPGNDWCYVLCETVGDSFNLYSGAKVASLDFVNGETVISFAPKLSRIENTRRLYRFEEV